MPVTVHRVKAREANLTGVQQEVTVAALDYSLAMIRESHAIINETPNREQASVNADTAFRNLQQATNNIPTTVFTAQTFDDQGVTILLGLFTNPEKAKKEIDRFVPHVDMQPSPIRGSRLNRWYWQNEDASLSAVIQETVIQ